MKLKPVQPVRSLETDAFLPVLGASMSAMADVLAVFAQQNETVLIAGPTGSGKSRLARWCHAQSQRCGKRFEVLDLLGVPEDLQMAELFGWRRGAFTGAIKDSPGALTRAECGTLFIDEIDKLSLQAQAGLLRVLEERLFRPVGDSGPEHHADVRFIVGTNIHLMEAVRAGRFREDLYYRINVLPVRVPALSERLDELPSWASYMLKRRHQEVSSSGDARLADDAINLLIASRWPGNLRQLDNIIRRAYALALLEGGEELRDVVLETHHIERALAHEENETDPALVDLMRQAAYAFVREAERHPGSVFSLDFADAFRGFVLMTAVKKLGSRDAALELLGMGGFVKSRNQHKICLRERDRLVALLQALGDQTGESISDLMSLDAPCGTE